METVALGFIIGYLLSVLFIGIGYALGANIIGKPEDDAEEVKPDALPAKPTKHTYEDMSQVLQVLRLGASRYEREILNEIIDLLEREDEENGN